MNIQFKNAALSLLIMGMLTACGGVGRSVLKPSKADDVCSGSKTNDSTSATPVATGQTPSELLKVIEATKPKMTDEFDKISSGATKLADWSMKHMSWSDLKAVPDTTVGLVLKDPSLERGKKICISGVVVEIEAQSVKGEKIYSGVMDANAYAYQFIAVKSTGNIVADSEAAFCGVVIGRSDYSNSAGGTTSAVQLVGMFDLPENVCPAQQTNSTKK